MSVRRPYTTCLNIELMTEIRELAQRKAKHQNELIEEAIQDLLRKYNDQDTIKLE
jgi:metal-responsive CopG/Arc/MetJ family transcriptional regulator